MLNCSRAKFLRVFRVFRAFGVFRGLLAHIDLARGGGGNQSRTVFLEPLDCFLNLGHSCIQLRSFGVEACGDRGLSLE